MEGASPKLSVFTASDDSVDGACPLHPPLFAALGGRSPSRHFVGEIRVVSLTPELAAQKKRLTVMAVINVVCVVIALASIVVHFQFALDWALFVFGGALLVGFATQIWFIAGFRRKGV